MANPEQQGLKHNKQSSWMRDNCALMANPEQQGLKPIPDPAGEVADDSLNG